MRPENTFVDILDLITRSEKYDNAIVTTTAYIIPTSDPLNGKYFLAFPSEASIYYGSEEGLHCLPNTASIHIPDDYSGYISLCGDFNSFSFAGTQTTFLSVKYFELLE